MCFVRLHGSHVVYVGAQTQGARVRKQTPHEHSHARTQAVRQYCKYAARPPSIDRFPFFLDRAIRIAVSGRPGPVCVSTLLLH